MSCAVGKKNCERTTVTEIFVGNLPFSIREDDLRNRFEAFGRVTSIRIPTNDSHQCRGFAFVSMPSLDDADEAIGHMAGVDIGGRRITVSESSGGNRRARQPTQDTSARNRTMDVFKALRGE